MNHPSPFGNRNRPRLSSFLSKNGVNNNNNNNVGVESSPGPTQKRRVSSFLGSFLQRNGSINSSSYDGDDSRSAGVVVGSSRSTTTSSSYFRTGNIVVELSNNGDGSESFVGGNGIGNGGAGADTTNLNDSFRSLMTSPTVESSGSYNISHPPTSTRQTRLRKLDVVGGCGGDGDGTSGTSSSSCKRMSLRQAMLQRYNNKSSSGMVSSGITRRRSSALKLVPFGDDDSTLATEPSSMELSPTMSPTPSAFHREELPIMSPELKKEMDEMDDVMRILKDKLGFKPVAIVGSRHESFSSLLPPLPMMSSPSPQTRKSLGSATATTKTKTTAILPTITSDDGGTTTDDDDRKEEEDPEVVVEEEDEDGEQEDEGKDDEIDDDLKKEIEEMESIMLTMKEVLGFKPVAIVGSRHESFTVPSSKAMSRAARRVSSSSSTKRRTSATATPAAVAALAQQ